MLKRMASTFANDGKVIEIDAEKILEESGLTYEQFVDVCILCGCDYCDSIRGIGPKKAFQLIKQHNNIETMLQHLDRQKYDVPANWNDGYEEGKDGEPREA